MKVNILSVLAGSVMLAGTANAAYTGLITEEYTNAVYDAPPDSITFRLYATFDNEMDQLTGLGGSAQEPWYLNCEPGYTFYNDDTYGGWWAHAASFDPLVAYLHYDSYWTIGTDDSAAGADLGIAFPGEDPIWDETHWFADDGGIYRTPEDELSFAGADLVVMIGQFTFMPNDGPDVLYAMGAVKMNMVSDGAQLNLYEDFLIPVPAPGALALLGLAGLIGRRRR